jgi:hypothetical protein
VTRRDARALSYPMDSQHRAVGVADSARGSMPRRYGPTRPPQPTDRFHADSFGRPEPAPVFVDRTGRRRRVLVIAGAGGAAALVGATIALLLGLTGTGDHALPGLPASTAGAHGPAAGHETSTRAPDGHMTPTAAASRPTVAPAPAPNTASAAPAPSATATPGQGSTHRRTPSQTPSHTKK